MCNSGLSCCHSTSLVRPTLNRGMMKGDFLLWLLWRMQFRPSHLLCHTVPSVFLMITACTALLGLLRELLVIMGTDEMSYCVLRPPSSASFLSFTQQVMTLRVRLSMSRVLPKEIDHVELMFWNQFGLILTMWLGCTVLKLIAERWCEEQSYYLWSIFGKREVNGEGEE